jgi:hypothetical protein
MKSTDLAQDARITAANLLAIVNGGHQNTAYAIDKMREAAGLLDRLAAHIAPPSAEDRDDETFGPAAGPRFNYIQEVNDALLSANLRIVDAPGARVLERIEGLTQADAERVASSAIIDAIERQDPQLLGVVAQQSLDAFEPGRWLFVSCEFAHSDGRLAVTVRLR